MPVYEGENIVPVYDGNVLVTPPLDFPTGLSSQGNIAWVGDGYAMTDADDLYFYDVLGRAILNKVFALRSGERYAGMAWDGTDLYAKHLHSARLYRISTVTAVSYTHLTLPTICSV